MRVPVDEAAAMNGVLKAPEHIPLTSLTLIAKDNARAAHTYIICIRCHLPVCTSTTGLATHFEAHLGGLPDRQLSNLRDVETLQHSRRPDAAQLQQLRGMVRPRCQDHLPRY